MKVKREIAYISGPMEGYPDYNFLAFMEAEEKWKDEFTIINPARTVANPGVDSREHLLGMDFVNVIRSQVIIMLSGFCSSEGAVAELIVAQQTGIRVIMSDTGEEIKQNVLKDLLATSVFAAIHTSEAVGDEYQ